MSIQRQRGESALGRREWPATPTAAERRGHEGWETAGARGHRGVTGDLDERRFGGVLGTKSHSKESTGKLEARNWKCVIEATYFQLCCEGVQR